MKKFLLAAATVTLAFVTVAAQAEISLYDAGGEAVVYIADDWTIYTWDGAPVAYLARPTSSDLSVYGFNGRHLGWFSHSLVIDHDGNTPCAVREALRFAPALEIWRP
jgi:hypothetical protein